MLMKIGLFLLLAVVSFALGVLGLEHLLYIDTGGYYFYAVLLGGIALIGLLAGWAMLALAFAMRLVFISRFGLLFFVIGAVACSIILAWQFLLLIPLSYVVTRLLKAPAYLGENAGGMESLDSAGGGFTHRSLDIVDRLTNPANPHYVHHSNPANPYHDT